jgi:hypothetical protein
MSIFFIFIIVAIMRPAFVRSPVVRSGSPHALAHDGWPRAQFGSRVGEAPALRDPHERVELVEVPERRGESHFCIPESRRRFGFRFDWRGCVKRRRTMPASQRPMKSAAPSPGPLRNNSCSEI